MNFNRELNDTAMIYLENFRRILEKMIEEMTGAKLCDSISYNFIIQMNTRNVNSRILLYHKRQQSKYSY